MPQNGLIVEISVRLRELACVFLGLTVSCLGSAGADLKRGEPLAFSYQSEVDGTLQPYMVYLPKSLPEDKPWSLVVALHGTSGSHQTFLMSTKKYDKAKLMKAAEKHQMAILCPEGRGNTEWWGIGENDVFRAIGDFQKRAPIDKNRIYLTGHSMGGGGTTYIALRNPGFFAAAAPMVGTLHFDLAENARYTPFYFLVGSREIGPRKLFIKRLADKMEALGYERIHEIVPGADHRSFVPDAWDRVFAWFSDKRLVRQPDRITHAAEIPKHGWAYWVKIDAMERPGTIARIDARRDGNEFRITTENIAVFRVFPDHAAIDPHQPLVVHINGNRLDPGKEVSGKEIVFEQMADQWSVRTAPLNEPKRGNYRYAAVARAEQAMTVKSSTDYSLAFWAADALRAASGADIAFQLTAHYRGVGIQPGEVTEDDLIQCIRPFLQPLCTVSLSGRQIVKILDGNVSQRWGAIFVSGMSYRFDPQAPAGKQIVEHSLDPDLKYSLCLGENDILRKSVRVPKGISLSKYQRTSIWNHAAYYGHAVRQGTLRVDHLDRRQKVVGN